MYSLYIYVCVYMWIHTYIHTYIHICIYVGIYTHTHKWLISFQESFGLYWLPGIHLAHVNTKRTLVDSLMGTRRVFCQERKGFIPCISLLFFKENGSGKNECQVRAIYVLWQTVQVCALSDDYTLHWIALNYLKWLLAHCYSPYMIESLL